MEILSFKDYRIKNAIDIQNKVEDADYNNAFHIDLLVLEKYVEYLSLCGYDKNYLIDFYDILETAATPTEINKAIHDIEMGMIKESLNIEQYE